MHSTQTVAKSIIRFATPPVDIKLPARIKKGTAINGKESTPAKQFWVINTKGIFVYKTKAASVATPMEIPMGTPRKMKTIKRKNSIKASILVGHLLFCK